MKEPVRNPKEGPTYVWAGFTIAKRNAKKPVTKQTDVSKPKSGPEVTG